MAYKVTRILHDGKEFESTVHGSLDEARARASEVAAGIFRTSASRDADYEELQETLLNMDAGEETKTMPGYSKCSKIRISKA